MASIATTAATFMRELMMSRGHLEKKKMKLLSKFYVLLTIIFIGNTILDICSLEAHQVEEKIFRFKNINMLMCGLAYPLINGDTYRLISHIEDQISDNFIPQSSKKRTLIKEKLNTELDIINKAVYSVVISSVVTLTFAPLLAAIFNIYPKLFTETENPIDVNDFALPISFWYPEKYSNLISYFSLYALQVFYMYVFAGYMYCTLTSGLMALKVTIYDMKILCLTVEEWESHTIQNGGHKMYESESFASHQLTQMGSGSVRNHVLLLRDSLVNVIKMHEMICRRGSSLNKNLEVMYTVWNNTICFQICVCLYSAAKMEDPVLKFEHILLVIPMAAILFFYCFFAQQLINEGQNFCKTLWESSFYDKPQWYKSSFLIIMTRNIKELEIKPFGFYVLNLRTFSVVMNAAYSYFNMLNSLNKRK